MQYSISGIIKLFRFTVFKQFLIINFRKFQRVKWQNKTTKKTTHILNKTTIISILLCPKKKIKECLMRNIYEKKITSVVCNLPALCRLRLDISVIVYVIGSLFCWPCFRGIKGLSSTLGPSNSKGQVCMSILPCIMGRIQWSASSVCNRK